MAKFVNNTPALVRPIYPISLQSLAQFDQLLVRSLFQELTEHASAINSVLPVEGTWTPTLTAATPGNLTVAYTTRLGRYIKNLPFVTLQFELETSSFTHTTASGEARITGLPFLVDPLATYSGFMTFFGGFTKANYTQMGTRASSANFISFAISGSGQVATSPAITDFPSGGTVRLTGEITYKIDQ